MSDAALLARLRGLLAIGKAVPAPEDQLDWAMACAAAGDSEGAHMLARCVFIRTGMSPQLRARQRAIADRLGFAIDGAERAVSAARDMMGIALEEWRGLAVAMAGRMAIAGNADPEAYAHRSRVRDAAAPLASAAAAVAALYDLLAKPAPDDWSSADALLASVIATATAAPPVDLASLAGADLPTIAELIGLAGLQDFVWTRRDLLAPPHGPAELLWRAARFDLCGLGPYFGNVPRLARNGRDLIALARIAEDAGDARTGRGLWIALLGHALPRPLLLEVIDELGDRNDMPALAALLRGGASLDPASADVTWRIRDAAIDQRDYALAAQAQARLVDLTPGSLTELSLLGSLEASGGLFAAAEQSFLACLAIDPLDAHVTKRLTAVRRRDFDDFLIEAGYTTPPDRLINRTLMREAALGSRERVKSSPVAVQFR